MHTNHNKTVTFLQEIRSQLRLKIKMEVQIVSENRLDIDQAAMGYKEWIRGKCVYDCAICNKRFFDR